MRRFVWFVALVSIVSFGQISLVANPSFSDVAKQVQADQQGCKQADGSYDATCIKKYSADYSALYQAALPLATQSIDKTNPLAALAQNQVQQYQNVKTYIEQNALGLMNGTTTVPDSLLNGAAATVASSGAPTPPAIPPAAKCVSQVVDKTLGTATLDPVDVNSPSATGTVANATSGTVQLCDDKDVSLGSSTTWKANGKFTVTLLANSTSGEKIQAQFKGDNGSFGPASTIEVAGSCMQRGTAKGSPPTLAILKDPYSQDVTFNLPKGTTGTFRLCVNDLDNGKADNLTPASDTGQLQSGGKPFTLAMLAANPSDLVTAQATTLGTAPYGPISGVVGAGQCSLTGIGDVKDKPTLNPVSNGSQSVSGSVPSPKPGTIVRICESDYQVGIAAIAADGTFTASLSQPVIPAQNLVVQPLIPSTSDYPYQYTFGRLSAKQTVEGFRYSNLFGSFITGFEQSGYSSDLSYSNFFLSAYIRSGYMVRKDPQSQLGLALWGRVRLLGAPAPSTQNIISVLADPTGQLTQTSFSNVNQVIDYVIGPELRLRQYDNPNGQTTRISLIALVGATTPLTSNQQTLTYNAPGPNTAECAALINRYPPNPSKGIVGLYPGPTDPMTGLQTNCIINPVTKLPYSYVVFTNQDRSNFLGKYGGGFRLTHVYPAKSQGSFPYSGWLDVGIGQDETITGGTFHGAVFKLDGQYPFAYGPLSFIYFFGSASMRLSGNQNYAPLILTVPTGSMVPTVPSANVTVLSTQQPNRDFYRIGVGINLVDVFTKLKNGPSTGSAATTTTTNTPAPATK